MKKILITGANSYIGTSFEKYINENYPDDYVVDTVDMIDGTWREKSFVGYDSIFHVAGIAHQKETKANAHLYYEVNRDLAIETAKKAKQDGVKQFIFLSSMSVYGMDVGVITKDTQPNPKSNYGKSKWQAEQYIKTLRDENFKVCIIRPPMVYGEGCKGNYQTLVKLVEKVPIFPLVNNHRSVVHIKNLVRFVIISIEEDLNSEYFPQNPTYVSTLKLVNEIAQCRGKRLYYSFLCGWVVVFLRPFSSVLKKAFGNLVYEGMEEFEHSYCIEDV